MTELRALRGEQPRSDIAGIPVHPLLEVLAIDDGAVQRIAESIAERGQDVPIALWRGMIVDGRHRARACARLGIDPKTSDLPEEWDEDHVEGYILDANFNRKEAPWHDRVAAYLRLRHGWPGEGLSRDKPGAHDIAKRVRLKTETAQQLDRLVAAARPGTKWGVRKTAHGGETVGLRAEGEELEVELQTAAQSFLRAPLQSPHDVARYEHSIVERIASQIETTERKRVEAQRAKEIEAAGAIDFDAKRKQQIEQSESRPSPQSRPKREVDTEKQSEELAEAYAMRFAGVVRALCEDRALSATWKDNVITRAWRMINDARKEVRRYDH